MKRDAQKDLEMCNRARTQRQWLSRMDSDFVYEAGRALPYWINRATKAEKLLRKITSITKWKNRNDYTECLVDDKTIAEIKEFLGDDQG